MTAPTVIQMPSIGEQLAPLLQALLNQQQMRGREEELKLRKGELKLAQDESTFKQAQEAEKAGVARQQREAMQAAAAALFQQLGGLEQAQSPAPAQGGGAALPAVEPPLFSAEAVKLLIATGDPTNVRAATELINDELVFRRAKQITDAADVTTPEGRAQLVANMSAVDPQRGQAIAQLLQTMQNRAVRTQFKDVLGADGKYHTFLIDMESGMPIQDFGEARMTWTDRLAKWGDVDQRNRAEGGVRMGTALNKISSLSVDQTALREAAAVVSAVTATLSFPMGVGDFISTAGRVTAQPNVSPQAQELLNNLWDFLAGRAFASGGKQLTKSEWDFASRSFAPLAGESTASWRDKLTRMYRERDTSIRLAGPAWDLVSDVGAGWSGAPSQGAPAASSALDAAIQEALSRIRARRQGGQP